MSDRQTRSLRETLPGDLQAGVTVALVGLPQCLAYALMSGLPPAYGLSTAAVAGLVAALAGRSAQVVTGPTNTTGLLILAALGPVLGANGLLGERGLPVLATLTLLAGAIRLAAPLLGGAHLVRFLPESVLVGFTAGAGILIAAMQLDVRRKQKEMDLKLRFTIPIWMSRFVFLLSWIFPSRHLPIKPLTLTV